MATGIYKVLIVGLGLMGASLAGALHKAYPKIAILGADVSDEVLDKAKEEGMIEAALPMQPSKEDLRGVGLVVLALPVDAAESWFNALSAAEYEGIVTDTASTKAQIIETAERTLAHPEYFVPGHPMAGREKGGIGAAKDDLYDGAYWILTPGEHTDIHVYRRLHTLLTGLGARVISVDPAEHDKLIASVSHVPHVTASALVTLASAHAGPGGEMLRLAAGGFKDTTRVAAGDPELWTGILMSNSARISEELSELLEIIKEVRDDLNAGDADGLREMLGKAAESRKSIPAKWVPESSELVEIHILMDNRPGIIAEITAEAGRRACNIQAIDIDHQTEHNAVLRLVLTDEGDIEGFLKSLEDSNFEAYRY